MKPLITDEEAADNLERYLSMTANPSVKALRIAQNWDGHYRLGMKCQQENGYWPVITSIMENDPFPLRSNSGGGGRSWSANGIFREDGRRSHHDLIGPYVQ